jgi:glycosyltransferase involved in cell wall biosynthesis
LENLDVHSGFDPYLLLFDRNPHDFERAAGVPFRAFPRSAIPRFYSELSRLSRRAPIRMVHAHNLYSAALAISARPFHGYKIVLDYHGRIPEEFVYLGKGGQGSRKVLEMLEAWTIRHSDHIIPVSNHLADYLKTKYRIASDNMSVIPCCTDSRTFRWYPALRESTRERLGLTHKLVRFRAARQNL